MGTGQGLTQVGRVVGHQSEAFVGIDTAKFCNAIADAEAGRNGSALSGEVGTSETANAQAGDRAEHPCQSV
jgi:hypothetical protein